MAGDPSGVLSWHGSGGAANTNSDLFLGGIRTNALIRHLNGTVGANGAAGDTRVFLTAVPSQWDDAVIYFRDGNAGGWSTRVTHYSTGSLWVDLLDPLPTSIAIGDLAWGYRVAYAMMPYKNTTALESSAGITQYSGCYVVNGGSSLPNFRFWIENIDPGPVLHEIAATNDQSHVLITIPNENTAPDLSSFLTGGGAGRFIPARTYLSGSPDWSFANGLVGFWIKRTGPADDVRRSLQRVAIVGESSNGVVSKLLLDWNTVGFTPLLAINHAPTVYLRGGARFKAVVRAQETGLVVPNIPVGFSKTAGPGTLQQPAAPGETDENGEILASYAAPTDIGEIGNSVTVEAQV